MFPRLWFTSLAITRRSGMQQTALAASQRNAPENCVREPRLYGASDTEQACLQRQTRGCSLRRAEVPIPHLMAGGTSISQGAPFLTFRHIPSIFCISRELAGGERDNYSGD
jgi:hypothetical protein